MKILAGTPQWQARSGALFQVPPFVKTPMLFSLLLSCVVTLLVLVFYFALPPVVPLFYSLAQTDKQLASKEWVFLFPFLSFFMSIVHIWIINWQRAYVKLLLQLFAWTSVLIQLMLLFGLARIIVVIT